MRFLAIASMILMPTAVLAASDCQVNGSAAPFGVDMTAYFDTKSGETCNFPMRIPGMMKDSGVVQPPAHGTLTQINLTTFTYTAETGYKGADSFAIYGIGDGPEGRGKSVMTVKATIQ